MGTSWATNPAPTFPTHLVLRVTAVDAIATVPVVALLLLGTPSTTHRTQERGNRRRRRNTTTRDSCPQRTPCGWREKTWRQKGRRGGGHRRASGGADDNHHPHGLQHDLGGHGEDTRRRPASMCHSTTALFASVPLSNPSVLFFSNSNTRPRGGAAGEDGGQEGWASFFFFRVDFFHRFSSCFHHLRPRRR